MISTNRKLLGCSLGAFLILSGISIANAEQESEPLPNIEVTCEWSNPLPKGSYRQGVEHHTFLSPSNNVEVGYSIYLPPGYPQGAERYPVQYFLGGKGNDENSQQDRWAEHLTPAIESKLIPPMIVVWPNPMKNSGYKDSQQMKIESMIIKELIPHIDATYRTIADREHRWISGMSMGGGGCLVLAFKYPELFSSVVTYAPAAVRVEGVLKPDHPAALVKKNLDRMHGMRVRIICGEKDRGCERARVFHAFLTDLGLSSEFEAIPNVGHNMTEMFQKVGVKGLQFHGKSKGK